MSDSSDFRKDQAILNRNAALFARECEKLFHWTSAWVLPEAANVFQSTHGLWTFYGTQRQEEANEVAAPKGTSAALPSVFNVTRQVKNSYVLTAFLPYSACSAANLVEFHALLDAVATKLGAPRDRMRRVVSTAAPASVDGKKPATPEGATIEWAYADAHKHFGEAVDRE